jgi:curved DNA-binding protein CbpA
MKDFREQNFYELLDITPHANQQELELSYQRARRVYSSDSVATYALFQHGELNLIRRRIEEAFRVLSNPERRALYDRDILQHEPGWIKTPSTESGDAIASLPQAPVALGSASAEPASGSTQPIDNAPTATAAATSTAPIANPTQKSSRTSRPDSNPALRRSTALREDVTRGTSLRQQQNADVSMCGSQPPHATAENVSPTMAFSASSPPSSAPRPPSVPKASSTPPASAQAAVERPPMPEIGEKTEFTGLLLAQVRLARGLTLERISDVTKVNIFYLRAFENEKYADLPAEVYVRGYLRQITTLLGLDSKVVVPSYLERMKKGLK